MGNLYDIQNGLLEAFADNVFLTDIVANLDTNNEETIQKVAEIFDVSKESIILTITPRDNTTKT
jgi:ABC-type transport system involved in cytochrome bd biosynthesis fused ATPase/permease subunit